ncbi:MoaD/ThiS family protein [Paenarthrobacter sp. CM16]|uniref:MoaD/ThiS family protein n=1 Tax=Paenarthrobacter sp. CM16 TaxID=2738447 RepID=UPI0028119C6F|nr:MoaD/ThiS family protein [Paenarthrobacter sp. CM16]
MAETIEKRVLVRYFAAAAEAAGCQEEWLSVRPGANLEQILAGAVHLHGSSLNTVLARCSFLVNGITRRDLALPASGEIDVLPPFAGG